MIPVMAAFLPPTHPHLYMPMFFKLWEAFNSHIVDDRLLEICGELSEEHISGVHDDMPEESVAEWKDVGIWSEAEWTVLATKALSAMSESTTQDSAYFYLNPMIQTSLWAQ
jgi:proteasome activator subunit 4